MLRAGPFSDERIVGLANRRFISFYFDLSNRGFAGDAAAREFVVAKRKELGGSSVPTPPVLFMTPDGEVVGEVSNYATVEAVLGAMRKMLARNPKYAEPTAAEEAAGGIELARIKADLLDYEGAREALAEIEGAEARYLAGHLARLAGDWKAMNAELARVTDEELADDVRMERAHDPWRARDYEKLKTALASFPRESGRYSEARYHLGLASYHLGDVDEARTIWKDMIGACSEDPWVYRADWAYYASAAKKKRGGRVSLSSGGKKTPLGRIGYMGRGNPDLDR